MQRFMANALFMLSLFFSFSFDVPDDRIYRVFISKSGSDVHPGTMKSPLASFEAAQQRVRTIRKSFPNVSVEVVVRGGVYFLEQTIEFTEEDSGTPTAPVVWKAADGEQVILSGGRRIKGLWQKGKNGIWFADVPQAKGWKRDVSVPEHYHQKPVLPWNFRELYVNGKRATRARYPNESATNPFMYAVASAVDKVYVPAGSVKASWADEADAQINLVPRWRFFNQWNDVVRVDTAKSILHLGPREQHFEIDKGSWFWIEGVKAELDMPGEWYLDHKEGRLYYKPLQQEVPGTAEVIAPFLNRIFYLRGDVEKGTYVRYIELRGFDFRHTTYTVGQIEARVHTDAVVLFENAQYCSVKDSRFQHIGGYAWWLHLDSKYNVFDHNIVQHSGGGGVLMTGSRLSYMDETKIFTPGEKAARVFPILNRITHNTVEHCGKVRYYGGGVHIDSRPASMAMEPGNYIAHNHFRDLSRNGIFAFRNQGGNVIEFNEIHDCMQTTIDGAAIHLATMNRLAAPNFILNNYLYDIWGYEQLPGGKPRRTLANGVFLDWATSYTTVRNNVIYNAGDMEIKPIMGNWNLVIENNLASKTRIQPFMPEEIGIKGTAAHIINPEQLRHIGKVVVSSDTHLVAYLGDWKPRRVSGMRNLFKYDCMQAAPDKPASSTYQLPVAESGSYRVCIMYFPDGKAASNATLTIQHAKGSDTVDWNFRRGDNLGFAVRIGEYYFEKGKPAFLRISNENTDGVIIADGVGIIRQ